MINLEKEKSLLLSAENRYTILNFAIQAADDNGFVNDFIFERALWLYAALLLLDDDKADIIRERISKDLITAWDECVEDGTIQELVDTYGVELDELAAEADTWMDNYKAYAYSPRGIMNTVQQFTGDIVQQASQQLQSETMTGAQEVMKFADNWGANNQVKTQTDNSLFSEEN